MARNVYAMSIYVQNMKMGYRVLSETAPEFHFGSEGRLRRIDWQPVEGEELTPEFLSGLVRDGDVQCLRVYRAQVNRGSREGAFGGLGGRPGSREPRRDEGEEPWR